MGPKRLTDKRQSNSGRPVSFFDFSFRKSNFAKLNTNELFNAVDADKNGNISEDEWMDFWREVRKSGHSEKEIESEVIKRKKGFNLGAAGQSD